jgi:protein phosphatase PTC1
MVAVCRAFGDFYLSPFITDTPYMNEIEVGSAKFVVVACDGVWDVLEDQEVVDIVRRSLEEKLKAGTAKQKALGLAALEVRDRAFLLGSDDNITVVVIALNYP